MKTGSATSNRYGEVLQIEEVSSLPINRCDPYNTVYVSPFSNTVAAAVSNGILFITLRQEKPALNVDGEFPIQSGASWENQEDGSLADSGSALFRNSLQILSVVDTDFFNEDPVGKFRPAFIPGLVAGAAELYYYDRFLAQKPASRQQVPVTLSRSLCRTSGAHVVKIFSAIVCLDKHESNSSSNGKTNKNGVEIVFAVSSTGGWYAFACKEWANPTRPIWQRIDSWLSTAESSFIGFPVGTPQKPVDSSESYLAALHSICTADLIAAESGNGQLLIYLLNGLGQLSAHVVDIFNPSARTNADFLDSYGNSGLRSQRNTIGLSSVCESKAVSMCYIGQSRTIACGCENGNIFLLRNVSPFSPPMQLDTETDLTISYSSSQIIWPHADIIVDRLTFIPSYQFSVSQKSSPVLVAVKGSFLSVWALSQTDYFATETSLPVASCQIDPFPIISVSSSRVPDFGNSVADSSTIARFTVCTQKGAYFVSLVADSAVSVLQINCTRMVSVADVSSPISNPSNKVEAATIASSINESFRKRHLSSQHWLFLGFDGSPNSKFFVAAIGIFSPCKASLLLSPPFSFKIFARKEPPAPICKSEPGQMPATCSWDDVVYELSSLMKREPELISLAQYYLQEMPSIDEGKLSIANFRYLQLHKICVAYSNGCCQVSAPDEVLAAKDSLKLVLLKLRVSSIIHNLHVDLDTSENISKFDGYIIDVVNLCSDWNIALPERLKTFVGQTEAKTRQKCPVCETALWLKLQTATTTPAPVDPMFYQCQNNHVFRPCSKSLLAFMPHPVNSTPILPLPCQMCGSLSLRYRPDADQSTTASCIYGMLLYPCTFCGYETFS